MDIQQHNCYSAGSKCFKYRDKKGNLKCRVPKQTASARAHFRQKNDLYDCETLEIFKRLGLRTVENGRESLDKNLIGGRWYYRAMKGEENRLPTIPAIAWSLQACTNVQMCDRKFLLSYLVKYNCSQDEKATVKITVKPNSTTAHVGNGEEESVQIRGQRFVENNERIQFECHFLQVFSYALIFKIHLY